LRQRHDAVIAHMRMSKSKAKSERLGTAARILATQTRPSFA
jgi:hypothetical protein